MNILVTGGVGFIGSHTVIALKNAGFEAIILDDLSNSEINVLDGITKIVGNKPKFYNGNCLDEALLDKIFTENKIEGVIHFAASKAVGESVVNPLKYYENNVGGTVSILKAMYKNKVSNFVFSSSCTVYGQPAKLPVTENSPVQKAESPYGNSKQICEEVIVDYTKATQTKAISLRYFNPIGAHESGFIGELPKGIPANLVPFITQTAIGKRDSLSVFGNDYPTPDGTCIRDYIHVVDLAEAHVAALNKLLNHTQGSFYDVFNIGSGQGNSVLEVIHAFEKVSGVKLKYEIKPRREGDITSVYADCTKSKNELGFETKRSLDEAVLSAWNWEKIISE